MYNGIGLSTVRGSGTNGYVQRNLSHVRPSKDKVNYKTEEDIKKSEAAISKGPNQGILDHERKRKLEVKCMELEEVLRDQGCDDEEIDEKVNAYRQMLLGHEQDKKAFQDVDEFGRPVVKDTHQLAKAQQEKNAKLKAAFGLKDNFIDGSSFERNRLAQEKADLEIKSKEKKSKKKSRKRSKSTSSSESESSSDSESSSSTSSSSFSEEEKSKKKKKMSRKHSKKYKKSKRKSAKQSDHDDSGESDNESRSKSEMETSNRKFNND